MLTTASEKCAEGFEHLSPTLNFFYSLISTRKNDQEQFRALEKQFTGTNLPAAFAGDEFLISQ
jgi:hypothetical protein